MKLRIYYYANLLSLKIRPFYEIFMLRKFGAIQCIAEHLTSLLILQPLNLQLDSFRLYNSYMHVPQRLQIL